MTRNRFLILCSAAALSASVLTGCEAEEDTCDTDADCGDGFVCEGATADEPEGQSASFTFEGSEYRLSNLADALDAGAERGRARLSPANPRRGCLRTSPRTAGPRPRWCG